MTKEEQFKAWWFKVTHPWTKFPKDPMELSKIVWDSAWTTATLGQFERAKAEAEAEIRAKLLADGRTFSTLNYFDDDHFQDIFAHLMRDAERSIRTMIDAGETSS